jgi:PAB-dependent poly(A)-specific ribonuclease subunit 3
LRLIDAAHVILTDKMVIRLTDSATIQVLRPELHKQVNQLQADDLHNFGRLLLCLACQSPTAASPQSLNKSMAHVGSSFSSELQQLLLLLLSPPVGGVVPTVQDALMVCSGRMMSRMAQVCRRATICRQGGWAIASCVPLLCLG